MNAISVIHPYRWNNLWVFDDEDKDLDKEPLVAGADTLLSMLSNNAEECSLMFSGNEFPEYDYVIEKLGPGVGGGTNYLYNVTEEIIHPLWLCPALFKYFDTAPDKIYFKLILKK
jgi:putative flippase GtrA